MQNSTPFLSPSPSPTPAPLPLLTSRVAPCSELNLSVTLSPAPKGQHTLKPRPPKSPQLQDQSQPRPCPQGQKGRLGSTKVCCEEPNGLMVTPEPHQLVRGQSRRLHHASKHWSGASATTSNPHPEFFDRAELNTTMTLRTELQSIQGLEFNTNRAVKQMLQRSERTKNQINIRATEEVNIARSQLLFTSLVSVDVQEDQLVSQVIQDRLLLAPLPCTGNNAQDGPSLFPLMTSDILRQRPLPLQREATNTELQPQTRLACFTFDLYKRRLRCETTS